MDIHEMIGAATTSIRAMEMKLSVVEDTLVRTKADNERLRTDLADETARRTEAQADLIHFRTVFEANVCLEAMKICKKMFELTHSNMLIEASEAVKRMVEEKQEQERKDKVSQEDKETIVDNYDNEKPLVLPADTEIDGFQKSDGGPAEGTIVAPPAHINSHQELKVFYRNSHLRQVPSGWRERPSFVFRDGQWAETTKTVTFAERKMREMRSNGAGQPMSENLSEYLQAPRTDLKNSVARTVLSSFGM